MSYEAAIHESQILILRHLLFTPSAGFAELQKQTELTSDHFSFHIKKLIRSGYIEKSEVAYMLTQLGKEYANRLDTDENEIERQPKVSVVLVVERRVGDRREFLAQQRLKQPYYGFWGRLGGKVRWGESFEQAARRELLEETGLDGDFDFRMIYRKRDYKKATHELLEDKVFVIMHTTNATGTLMEQFEGGRNEWLTQEEFIAKEKTFESARDFITLLDRNIPYHTGDHYYEDDEY